MWVYDNPIDGMCVYFLYSLVISWCKSPLTVVATEAKNHSVCRKERNLPKLSYHPHVLWSQILTAAKLTVFKRKKTLLLKERYFKFLSVNRKSTVVTVTEC